MEYKIENNEEATILEITRLIKEFQEIFKDKTSKSE
jgi:hypothetical protein